MKRRKIVAVFLLLVNFIMLSGCWNYREVETLSIVPGFAIDSGNNGLKYHVTFDTIDITQGKEKPAKSKLIETDGNTIFDAARNAMKTSNKRLYFGDSSLIIIEKQLAMKGIAPILDWMIRDHELRKDIDIVISKENTALDIIKQKGLTNQVNSSGLDEMMLENKKLLAKTPYVELYQANNLLGGNGISLVLPAVSISTNMGETASNLDGMAIFKKDRLIGFLDVNESRDFLIATNQVKGGLFLVKQDSGDPDITLEIRKNKTVITPVLKGDKPQIKIAVQMDCSMYEMQTDTDYGNADALKIVEKSAEDQIKKALKTLITKVQMEYGSDIFGFGNSIYKRSPKYWEKVKPHWDEMFETLPVDVTAKVKIYNAGILQSKIKVGD